jgi:ribosome-binding factor A
MKSKYGFQRADRVSQQILETLARIMLTEVRDPRVQNLQFTDVELSEDLRHAKVFFVPMLEGLEPAEELEQSDVDTDPELQEIFEGLEHMTGFLRSKLGERLELRHVPELLFRYDLSVSRGRRIEKLLDEVREDLEDDQTEDE